jgi:tetratricopeptide (TPR) repeat protein
MKKIIIIFIFTIFSDVVIANDDDCLAAIRSHSLTLENQDWEQVIKSSNQILKECPTQYSNKEKNNLKGAMAAAYSHLGNIKKSLKSADDCIDNFYNEPVCHYWRAANYRDLGLNLKFIEAKKNAYAVCNAVIKQANEDLRSALDELGRIKLRGQIEVANIVIRNLNDLN